MELYQIVMEHMKTMQQQQLMTRQLVLEQMLESCLKESDYIDCCLNYGEIPYQEAAATAGEEATKVDGKVKKFIANRAGDARNMITRIRALTRRNTVILKTLSSHATDVLNGFRGKFRKSGAKKSVSQIAHENLLKKLDPDKKLAESEARVKVPYTGDVKQDDIVLNNSAILIKEFDDDNNFTIDLLGVNYLKNDNGKDRAISDKGRGVKSLASLILYTNSMIYFIKHPDEMDHLAELIQEGFDIVSGKKENNGYAKKVSKLTIKAHAKTNAIGNTSVRLTMKELTTFQKKMSEMATKLDFAQNSGTKMDNVDKEVIQSLNDLVNMLEYVQFGLTSLTNAIQKVHLIDLKFMNSITDRNALSKFVYSCVTNGIPPKFIAYNTWLIANESLRGNSSKYKPIGGQSRCVFFPEDNKKEILKIAINGNGIIANKNEIRMSDVLKKSNEKDILQVSALVTNHYEEDAILAMERIVDRVGKHPDLEILNTVKNQFKDFTSRHPELRLVVSDFNDGNIMWSSDRDCWVCIDYGLGRRNAKKQEVLEEKAEKAIARKEMMNQKINRGDDN